MLPDPSTTMPYKKLTTRNTIITLALFITPFLILFFIVNKETSSRIKNQVYSRLANTVEENAKTIGIFLNDRKTDLKSYSRVNVERVDEVATFSSFLATLLQEKKWYDFLIIADLEGNIVLSLNREIRGNIGSRPYFQASKEGNPAVTTIFFSDIIREPVMILSHPLKNRTGATIGVLAASLNLKNFYNLLFDLRLGQTSELFLCDSEGTLLSPTKLGGRPLLDRGYWAKGNNPHLGEKGVTDHLDYRGQRVLCAYRKLPEVNFYLVSEMDLKEALLPVKDVNRSILYLFLPFFLLLVVISNLYSQRITALLKRLTSNLQKALEESREKRNEVDTMNITLEKKVRESELLTRELQLSEEYIFHLIDSISFGVIGLDTQGKITHSNKEIRDVFGLEGLKKGLNIFTVLPWLNDREVELAYENTVLLGKPHRVGQKKIERGRGEEYFNLSFFPIENGTGKIMGVTILIENVTEQERLRGQLAEYEKLSALSQLALGAAHEINNPLLGISSYLEILAEGTESKAEKEEIAVVLENVYRISETIRGLLNFARPTPPQFTKVNLNQLIEDTLSFLSHQPIFKKVSITRALSPSLPQITADLNQIRQVLTNMLINAAQSMPQGGELRLETLKVKFKEYVQIDIADTGIGIPPENLKKIFDPFFTTKKSQGTGLGLSISLSYIKNHDGDIFVRSEVNKGTTFSIWLPIRQKGKVLPRDEEVIS